MFYPNGGAGTEYYGQDFRSEDQAPTTPQPVTPGPLAIARNLPSISWSQPVQTGSVGQRANNQGNRGDVYQAHTDHTVGVSRYPYINSSPHVSSDLFPAPSVATWPYTSGSNPPLINVNTSVSRPWQSIPSNAYNFSETPQTTERFSPIVPHQVFGDEREYQLRHPIHHPKSHLSDSRIEHLGFHLSSGLPKNMQNYPSPQYSDISDPTFAAPQKMVQGPLISPSRAVLASPSIAESSVSVQSSHKSVEPSRNAEGILFCNHPEHGFNAPTFARKCEWSKHMDKHTRPYICEEPGCENRGFTYSGGLNRHQREVHNQYGGPKARCMCPYQDCKRSTGQGFARRENLMEHIRRVHIVPAEKAKVQVDEAVPPQSRENRKRKRRTEDANAEQEHQDDSQQSSQNLRQEVKKLKQELQQKNERLRELEQRMEQINKAVLIPRKQ